MIIKEVKQGSEPLIDSQPKNASFLDLQDRLELWLDNGSVLSIRDVADASGERLLLTLTPLPHYRTPTSEVHPFLSTYLNGRALTQVQSGYFLDGSLIALRLRFSSSKWLCVFLGETENDGSSFVQNGCGVTYTLDPYIEPKNVVWLSPQKPEVFTWRDVSIGEQIDSVKSQASNITELDRMHSQPMGYTESRCVELLSAYREAHPETFCEEDERLNKKIGKLILPSLSTEERTKILEEATCSLGHNVLVGFHIWLNWVNNDHGNTASPFYRESLLESNKGDRLLHSFLSSSRVLLS